MTLTSPGGRAARNSLLVCAVTLVVGLGGGCAPVPTDPVRVVAVTAPTAQQARPVLGGEGIAVVRRAAESDRGTFSLIVAGAPQLAVTVDLVARRDRDGSDEVEFGPRRPELIDDAVRRAAGAVSAVEVTAGPPDLWSALVEAVRGVPGTLLVLDSGVTTTDPVDLRRLGWDGDPNAVIASLRAEDMLPELGGWDVVFVGLGRVSGDQTALGLPQQRWLERFWLAICAAGGARSCGTAPVLDSPSAPPEGTRSGPAVAVPQVRTVELAGGGVEATIPDSRLGFPPGSADLAPDAAEALAPVVDAYRRAPGRVEVAGYVAYWGDPASGVALSQARADAVARLLVSLGIPAVDVFPVGRGAADGIGASTVDGRFDEAKVVAAGICRVVITLSPRS
jgi:flagellar motor protein MotB